MMTVLKLMLETLKKMMMTFSVPNVYQVENHSKRRKDELLTIINYHILQFLLHLFTTFIKIIILVKIM